MKVTKGFFIKTNLYYNKKCKWDFYEKIVNRLANKLKQEMYFKKERIIYLNQKQAKN